MARGMKIGNEYAGEFGSLYDQIPKAVFAAVAFSFAMRLVSDDRDKAVEQFLCEWESLFNNGIVPQTPQMP